MPASMKFILDWMRMRLTSDGYESTMEFIMNNNQAIDLQSLGAWPLITETLTLC